MRTPVRDLLFPTMNPAVGVANAVYQAVDHGLTTDVSLTVYRAVNAAVLVVVRVPIQQAIREERP